MAIAAVNTATNGSSGASVSINVPTGTLNGHLMLAFIVSEGTITPPSGWTFYAGQNKLSLYWRIASSEPSSYSWSTAVNGIAGNVTTYSGAARIITETHGQGSSGFTGSTSFTAGGGNIVYPGTWLVAGFSIDNTGAITVGAGLTAQGSSQSDSVSASVAVGTATQSATTTTAPTYSATGTSGHWGVLTVFIQPGVSTYSADTTNNGRVLSQIRPFFNVLWNAYTVPTGANAIVNSIVAANTGGGSDTISVSVAVAGAADATKQYIYTSLPTTTGTFLVLTTGITLQAGDVIRVKANGNTAFTIFGQEVTSGDYGKVLGQAYPSAATLTTLYTVPSSGINWTAGSCLLVSNQGSVRDYFRVSIQVGGGADDISQYMYYDVPIDASDTFEATIGVPLSLTDVVKVQSLNGTCSFNLFGAEIQAA